MEKPAATLNRRAALIGGLGLAAAGAGRTEPASPPFAHAGTLSQGGVLICRTRPRGAVSVDGAPVGSASRGGLFVVGFDRDAPPRAAVAVAGAGAETLAIAPVDYDVQRIDGLPTDQVEPSDPALLARIKRELAVKTAALASRDDSENFRDGFVLPVQGARRSSRFGGQRVLNGVPKRPHYGVDLAAPVGTPIAAPAPGLVVLAEPNFHFEGGLTLIDHGQGLISIYLHQSHQDVAAGQRVERGQRIGLIGMTGRATGPHLCWRMKWRDRNLDPSLLLGVTAPA